MTTNNDPQRVRFERHMLSLNPLTRLARHPGGAYRTVTVERAWQLWQVAVQPAMPADAWQPIETAPKDGTDVMLTDGEHVTVGHWIYEPGGTTEYRDADGRWIGQDDRDEFAGWIDWMGGIDATHWMPLPAASRRIEGES